MSHSHGNTPQPGRPSRSPCSASWSGPWACSMDPVSMVVFWVGAALTVGSLVVFAVMAGKLGYNESLRPPPGAPG